MCQCVVRIHRQNKLTNLKRAWKTGFVSLSILAAPPAELVGASPNSPPSLFLPVFSLLPSKSICKCNLDFLF